MAELRPGSFYRWHGETIKIIYIDRRRSVAKIGYWSGPQRGDTAWWAASTLRDAVKTDPPPELK